MTANSPVILFEDKYVIVCQKPVGTLSQYSDNTEDNMVFLLSAYLEEKGEKPYVGTLHRLDRGVGGVMVYSKNEAVTSKLTSLISQREFKKEYLCTVNGILEEKSGELVDLLFKDSSKNKSYVVKRMRKGVKEASLNYRVLEEKDGLSLIHVKLNTGRTHQIRVQFSSRGYALLGDGKYGSRNSNVDIALWSHRIAFTHPITKKQIDVTAIPDVSRYPWNLFNSLQQNV